MELKKQFISSDVVRIFDISQNLLTQWLDRGFIKPSWPAEGSGTRNNFSLDDLCKIELFRQLIDAGYTRRGAAAIAFTPGDGMTKSTAIEKAISDSIKIVLSGKQLEKLSIKDKILIAVGKFKKYQDASLSSWVIKTSAEFRKLYDYRGSIWENDIVYLVNFTNIAQRVIAKIKEVAD